MTTHRAKEILASRQAPPDPASAEPDPELEQALALARKDPELQNWLNQQWAFNAAVRAQVRSVRPPDDLAARILADPRRRVVPFPRYVLWIAAAAAIVLLLGIAGTLMPRRELEPIDEFRSRMVRLALREYRMDIVTNDLASIRGYLQSRECPAAFSLPPGLSRLTPVGGGALRWQGHPVSMVCLRSNTLGMMYLFVVATNALDPGPGKIPATVSRLETVTWTDGGSTYLLAATAPSDELSRLP